MNVSDLHSKYGTDSIKDSLTRDQYRLYKLIWSRFVSPSSAEYDTISTDIVAGDYNFKQMGKY